MDNHELPELCYVETVDSEYLGIVKRGEKGYYKTDYKKWPGGADEINELLDRADKRWNNLKQRINP